MVLLRGFDNALECSGPLVQGNGVGFSLYFFRYRINKSFKSFLERRTLGASASRVRMEKAFILIQEAYGGV